jgi:hypothetical protein
MLHAVTSDHSPLSHRSREALARVASLAAILRLDAAASQVCDFLASSRGLVAVVRALQSVEHTSSVAADDAEDAYEADDAERWDALAGACSEAIRSVLADYERAVWL